MANDVQVRIGGDATPLSAGLRKAQGSIEDFRSKATGTFTKIGSQLAGVFAFSAIVGGFKEILDWAGRVSDLAARFNAPAESIQRLSHAAEQSGSSMEGMVKALTKATQNAHEANKGSTALQESFRVLGLDAKQFISLSLDDKMIALADSYEKAGDKNAFLAEAIKVTGKSGADLIPLLAQGADGVRKLLGEASTLSEDAINRLDSAGDRIQALFNTLRVVGASVLNFLYERVEALGVGFAAILAYVEALPQGLGAAKEAFNGVIDAAAELKAEEMERQELEKKAKGEGAALQESFKEKSPHEEVRDLKKEREEAQRIIREKRNALIFENAGDKEKLRYLKQEEEHFKKQRNIAYFSRDFKKAAEWEVKRLDSLNKYKDIQQGILKDQKEAEKDAKKESDKKLRDEAKGRKEAQIADKEAQLEGAESRLESALSKRDGITPNIDSIKEIGGGLGVDYKGAGRRADEAQRQVDLLQQQLDVQKKQLEQLRKANQVDLDGSFEGA